MACNCNNTNNGTDSSSGVKIKHVYGNLLRLAIPLTLRTLELVETEVDGETTQEIVATDTDFIPSSNYPVNVVFSKGNIRISLTASMRDGNVAYIEDSGSIPIGTYDITVTCKDDNGNPYRFKQKTSLSVVDATIDADITLPAEFESAIWYLDAGVFMALKGEDGLGIVDIQTQSSSEIGGMNVVTITLTDGTTRTFTVMNGSGSVDQAFDINSPYPVSNAVVTTKFNQLDQSLEDVFGDVDYDGTSKTIRFFAKGKPKTQANVLASLDARPFIKDGMVSSAYISNNTLVIIFNTDSGREPIAISLSSIFNPNNYYTRQQVNNLVDGFVQSSDIINETTNKVYYSKTADVVLENIDGSPVDNEGDLYYNPRAGQIVMMKLNNFNQPTSVALGVPNKGLIYACKKDKKTYIWDGEDWQQVGGSGDGGMQATYSDGTITITGSGSSQPTYSNGTITL